tara:strand:- start:11097 stop:11924 length:828 start_codon:yes stop_codon:yes gene_type:complete
MYKYLFFIFFISCSYVKDNSDNNNQILAKVGEKVLLKEDIIYEKSMGDSSAIFSNQINIWLKKQLLLKSAYETKELKSIIERKIQSYRDDLILYEFEKFILMNNKFKEITLDELKKYYDKNIDDFILRYNLVKALYVELPLDSPNLSSFISDFKDYPNIDKSRVRSYIYQFSEKSFLEDSIWIKFDDVIMNTNFPSNIDKNRFIKLNNYYRVDGDSNTQLFRFIDRKLVGDFSPLSFETEIINTIILNKRKQDLFNKLRDSIFFNSKEGLDYELF